MTKGYLAMVLHAHLPFVRHPEEENVLEEHWLFEAITESYLPLLDVLEGLVRDGADFRLTVSLSPTLITMLRDPLLQERYLFHLNTQIGLAAREMERTAGNSHLKGLADFYFHRFSSVRKLYLEVYRGNVLEGFKKFQDMGKLELITCGATHGFFPLMITEEAVRAQVKAAVDLYSGVFGRPPAGLWLPECGYAPGVDRILKDYGIRYFFTDTHAINHSFPKPPMGVHAPLFTPSGVAAFGRDTETSRQVWDRHEGYPGDWYYREFYSDIGYELDVEYLQPYLHPDGVRIDTGIKYYRVTGSPQKELYIPEQAEEKAAEHAGNFLFNRQKQVEHLVSGKGKAYGQAPIVISPYDAELFGHWWFEGPSFINYLLRKTHFDQDTVKTITPSEYLDMFPPVQSGEIPMSSWGHKGYSEMWLNNSNDWIYRHLHAAETRMKEMARRYRDAEGLTRRALNQAARELLLAQGSDWAFIMKTETAVPYATRRTREHLARFNRIYEGLAAGDLGEEEISMIEEYDCIFPDMDYCVYGNCCGDTTKRCVGNYKPGGGRRILMLSWEFPPKTVGGLARHVHDLSIALAAQGEEVHVITCHEEGLEFYENVAGVHVHRVNPYQHTPPDFIGFVLQLNLKMVEKASELKRNDGPFDVLHAHDWLVAFAARTLKHNYKLPLVATIHATEQGRQKGLHNDMQRYINDVEWSLTYEAWQVIVCSQYMFEEVKGLFECPPDKINIIPNGINPEDLALKGGTRPEDLARPGEKVVFFVGRIVPEKGVQVLLEAAPQILEKEPETRFLIGGEGPYLDYLKGLAEEKGIQDRVTFLGYVNDEVRNAAMARSSAAVFPSLYEPFGIVALEAMAADVPVVVSDTGGLGEIITHGLEGLKVPPGNVEALAQAITLLLQEPALGRKITEAARGKLATCYNWKNIASQTKMVYDFVLKEGDSAQRAGCR